MEGKIWDMEIKDFLEVLASKSPVPGGGGVSALGGAMGSSLGSMVCNLTIGKKKYQNVESEIKYILDKADILQKELLSLVEKDAIAFEPLSKAYSLPKNTESELEYRSKVMEECLLRASLVPIEIMEKSLEMIELHERLAEVGSKIAISDVGVGVQFCKSALFGAAMNVYINTKLMKDRDKAKELNQRTKQLIKIGSAKADDTYNKVVEAII